jgi:hypothetical protein
MTLVGLPVLASRVQELWYQVSGDMMAKSKSGPSRMEINRARSAFQAILKWCDNPDNRATALESSREYFINNAQLGLQMLSPSITELPLKSLRAISWKTLKSWDPEDDYSGRSQQYELICESGKFTFSSHIECTTIAYSYSEEFVCCMTGEEQFPVTKQKLDKWLTGFVSQLQECQNFVSFIREERSAS